MDQRRQKEQREEEIEILQKNYFLIPSLENKREREKGKAKPFWLPFGLFVLFPC